MGRMHLPHSPVPSSFQKTYGSTIIQRSSYEEIITAINQRMQEYLVDKKMIETVSEGAVLVERMLPSGKVRTGVVVAIDLEQYEYKPGNQALIRATERTIESRIPPRLKIRENATVELPHILVLIDDPGHTVIEPLKSVSGSRVLYDFQLMEGAGRLKGSWIDDAEVLSSVTRALRALKETAGGLLFAVGDGNHSLATAKHHWETLKSGNPNHPARFALVEIENVHDASLYFEPIHRLITGKINPANVLADFVDYLKTSGQEPATDGEGQEVDYAFGTESGKVVILKPHKVLAVATLTDFLDQWIVNHPEAEIDYVHGLHAIETHPEALGFILPSMEKGDLFKTVKTDGILPRKTFSMGSADEKRFYFEAKFIR